MYRRNGMVGIGMMERRWRTGLRLRPRGVSKGGDVAKGKRKDALGMLDKYVVKRTKR